MHKTTFARSSLESVEGLSRDRAVDILAPADERYLQFRVSRIVGEPSDIAAFKVSEVFECHALI